MWRLNSPFDSVLLFPFFFFCCHWIMAFKGCAAAAFLPIYSAKTINLLQYVEVFGIGSRQWSKFYRLITDVGIWCVHVRLCWYENWEFTLPSLRLVWRAISRCWSLKKTSVLRPSQTGQRKATALCRLVPYSFPFFVDKSVMKENFCCFIYTADIKDDEIFNFLTSAAGFYTSSSWIVIKPIRLEFLEEMLLAGVTQKIEFELSFGTESLRAGDSEFQITPSDGSDLEFWVIFCCKKFAKYSARKRFWDSRYWNCACAKIL